MPIPKTFEGRLALPAITAPMFLVSGPDLVVETCRAGVVCTFPALNQRTSEGYSDRLGNADRGDRPEPAPCGINLIVHPTRLYTETGTVHRPDMSLFTDPVNRDFSPIRDTLARENKGRHLCSADIARD